MRQFLACAVLLSPLACSNNHSAVARELAEMRQRIAILQSERERLEERVQRLERHGGAGRLGPSAEQGASARDGAASQQGASAGRSASSADWRPSLQVVRLTPDTPQPQRDPPEPEGPERYLIYGTGDELEVRELTPAAEPLEAATPRQPEQQESQP